MFISILVCTYLMSTDRSIYPSIRDRSQISRLLMIWSPSEALRTKIDHTEGFGGLQIRQLYIPSTAGLSVWLPPRLSVCLYLSMISSVPVCMFVCVAYCVCQCVCLAPCVFLCMIVYLSICACVNHLSFFYLFVCLPI